MGLFLGFAALFTWIWNFQDRFPAVALLLQEEGLEVHYRRNRIWHLAWSRPSFRLRILDESLPPQAATFRHCVFYWRPRLILTDEAVEALVSAATRHGLNVRTLPDSASRSGQSILITARSSRTPIDRARPS
jgi:hypothetical protein